MDPSIRVQLGKNAAMAMERINGLDENQIKETYGKIGGRFAQKVAHGFNQFVNIFKTGKFTTNAQACVILNEKAIKLEKKLNEYNKTERKSTPEFLESDLEFRGEVNSVVDQMASVIHKIKDKQKFAKDELKEFHKNLERIIKENDDIIIKDSEELVELTATKEASRGQKIKITMPLKKLKEAEKKTKEDIELKKPTRRPDVEETTLSIQEQKTKRPTQIPKPTEEDLQRLVGTLGKEEKAIQRKRLAPEYIKELEQEELAPTINGEFNHIRYYLGKIDQVLKGKEGALKIDPEASNEAIQPALRDIITDFRNMRIGDAELKEKLDKLLNRMEAHLENVENLQSRMGEAVEKEGALDELELDTMRKAVKKLESQRGEVFEKIYDCVNQFKTTLGEHIDLDAMKSEPRLALQQKLRAEIPDLREEIEKVEERHTKDKLNKIIDTLEREVNRAAELYREIEKLTVPITTEYEQPLQEKEFSEELQALLDELEPKGITEEMQTALDELLQESAKFPDLKLEDLEKGLPKHSPVIGWVSAMSEALKDYPIRKKIFDNVLKKKLTDEELIKQVKQALTDFRWVGPKKEEALTDDVRSKTTSLIREMRQVMRAPSKVRVDPKPTHMVRKQKAEGEQLEQKAVKTKPRSLSVPSKREIRAEKHKEMEPESAPHREEEGVETRALHGEEKVELPTEIPKAKEAAEIRRLAAALDKTLGNYKYPKHKQLFEALITKGLSNEEIIEEAEKALKKWTGVHDERLDYLHWKEINALTFQLRKQISTSEKA